MRHAVVLGAVLAVVWALWSGHGETLIVSLGVVSIVLTVGLSRRLGIVDPEGAPLGIVWRAGLYLPWLLKEILVANLDVARRILDPRLPIQPTVIEVQSTQRTDLGRVIYANSITLTPGTVTIKLDDEGFTVHALTREMAADFPGEMDRRVTRVEGGS